MVKKEVVKKAPVKVKKIRVVLLIEGSMVDKDTPLSTLSIRDYFELHFQCPKGLKAHVVSTAEVQD